MTVFAARSVFAIVSFAAIINFFDLARLIAEHGSAAKAFA